MKKLKELKGESDKIPSSISRIQGYKFIAILITEEGYKILKNIDIDFDELRWNIELFEKYLRLIVAEQRLNEKLLDIPSYKEIYNKYKEIYNKIDRIIKNLDLSEENIQDLKNDFEKLNSYIDDDMPLKLTYDGHTAAKYLDNNIDQINHIEIMGNIHDIMKEKHDEVIIGSKEKDEMEKLGQYVNENIDLIRDIQKFQKEKFNSKDMIKMSMATIPMLGIIGTLVINIGDKESLDAQKSEYKGFSESIKGSIKGLKGKMKGIFGKIAQEEMEENKIYEEYEKIIENIPKSHILQGNKLYDEYIGTHPEVIVDEMLRFYYNTALARMKLAVVGRRPER